MEEKTVTISVDRFTMLIAAEERCKVLETYIKGEKYSPNKKLIAGIIGFELPAGNEDD